MRREKFYCWFGATVPFLLTAIGLPDFYSLFIITMALLLAFCRQKSFPPNVSAYTYAVKDDFFVRKALLTLRCRSALVSTPT